MIPIYRYFLKVDNGARQACKPVYKDDLALNYEMASGQQYHRAKLGGKITFIADDFDTITSAAWGASFFFDIEISTDRGLTWSAYHSSQFRITDCTVDYDGRMVTVTPDTVDRYTAVTDGMEREYNLIKLAPSVAPVVLYKRPMLQFYRLGSSKVTNMLRGMTWEVDAQGDTSESFVKNHCHFGVSGNIIEFHVTGSLPTGTPDTFSEFLNYGPDDTFTSVVYNSDNTYSVHAQLVHEGGGVYLFTAFLRRESDQATIASCSQGGLAYNDIDDYSLAILGDSSGTLEIFIRNIYARVVCNVDTLGGVATEAIPADDIVSDSRNYTRCLPFTTTIIRASKFYQADPTEWGERDDNEYYLPPSMPSLVNPVPVMQSSWRWASLWMDYALYPSEIENGGRDAFTLYDAWTLSSCISVLLDEIAPGITHQATTDYSEFLYSSTNPVSGDAFTLLLTCKSNILVSDYSQASQRGTVTLKTLLDALRDIYQCYWFIDTSNRFRIEHISWFKNGGSYTPGSHVIGRDYTNAETWRLGKKWAFGTSEVTYEKSSMPERYEFAWMDDVTSIFTGNPIVVESVMVQRDRKEEVKVANITTDVDYMLLSPTECSKDGFALLACKPADGIVGDGTTSGTDGHCSPRIKLVTGIAGRAATLTVTATGGGIGQVYFYTSANATAFTPTHPTFNADGQPHSIAVTIPTDAKYIGYFANGTLNVTASSLAVQGTYEIVFPTVSDGVETYQAQNGWLAFCDLQPKYWLDDMPDSPVKVNGTSMAAHGLMRVKKQTITAPVGDTDPDPTALVRTYIGDGSINSMQINILSRTAKFSLSHEH